MFDGRNSNISALSLLLVQNVNSIKSLKVEFENGKYYINCSTRGTVLKGIKKLNPVASVEECCEIFRKLQKINAFFSSQEAKMSSNVNFGLFVIVLENGKKIPKSHFGKELDFKCKESGEKVKSLIHATKNVPIILENSQRRGVILHDLLVNGSKDPGSIWTQGNYTIYKENLIEKVVKK
jgi:hypothetical protein